MATRPAKPDFEVASEKPTMIASLAPEVTDSAASGRDALQALLAFSSLQQQIRLQRAREADGPGYLQPSEADDFVLYEVLQMVAERALALTGADGVAIALVQQGEIICRAASGPIAPAVGARLDPDLGFSGICFRTAEVVCCQDTENDPRVDIKASRQLHTRSMIAVPLRGRRSVVGLLEAFSINAYGFNDGDVRSLTLLAELILGAMKPEEEEQLEQLSPVKIWTPPSAVLPPCETQQGAKTNLESKTLTDTHSEQQALSRSTRQSIPRSELLTKAIPEVKPESARPLATKYPGGQEAQKQALGPGSAVPATVVSVPVEGDYSDSESDSGPAPLPGTLFREYERVEGSRPGLLVAIALLTAAAVCASGLWWKFHNPGPLASATPRVTQPGTVPPSLPPSPAPVEPQAQSPVSTADAQRNVLPMISGVRHWESGDSATVVVDLQDQVQYEVHRLNSPERIYFDLHDTVLSPALSGKTIEVGDQLLLRIRIAQPVPGTSRVVLETKNASKFSISLEPNPWRLIAEIQNGATSRPSHAAADLWQPPRLPDATKLSPAPERVTKEDLQLRARVPHMKIVIDAGHGGWDLGTVGRQGLLEKDLVLDIAQRLGSLLSQRLDSEVIFTRADDNYISLEKRAQIANEAQADLFVSIHANYSDLPSARGVETYYTNVQAPADSLDIEKRENLDTKVNLGTTLNAVAFKERTQQSRRLAASIERALYGDLAAKNPGVRDRGVKEAGFVVLTGTAMPAVLAEVSFVSSPTDEQNLESSGYRQQIAQALYKGIARYAASSASFKLASAAEKTPGK